MCCEPDMLNLPFNRMLSSYYINLLFKFYCTCFEHTESPYMDFNRNAIHAVAGAEVRPVHHEPDTGRFRAD